MKIIRYKKVGKNKYRLELENFDEIILYEDVILKEDLLIKKEIDNIENIININNEYALYDKTLSYLNKRIRCEKEIREYLKKYTKDINQIDLIINKLKDKEKEKIIKKYSKKYSGIELDKIVKQKLCEKGYWN